jgi:outer membrane immunogenic protein
MTRTTYLVAAVALALTSSAQAADLYRPSAYGYKDAPEALAPAWAGFYVGVNGGYGWSAEDSTVQATIGQLPPQSLAIERDGGFGGGQIGYNYQANRFVVGVEADIQGGDIRGEHSVSVPNIHVDSGLDWFGTVRGRLGYTVDRALIYATGGFAYGGASGSASVKSQLLPAPLSADKDTTLTGFTLGGGVEYSLNPRWSLKAEYQYLDFGSNHRVDSYGPAKVTYDTEPKFDTVRLGLNYRLQDIAAPLK